MVNQGVSRLWQADHWVWNVSDDWINCDRCGRNVDPDDTKDISIDGEYEVCPGCATDLTQDIEQYDADDRYTEEQHERAVSLLSDRDEIECVISSYEDKQIIVHTPYVSSEVVIDFCDHFGFYMNQFEVCWEEEYSWPCVSDHGSIFQIVLSYTHRSRPPIPLNAKFTEDRIDNLTENDKQF